MQRANAFLIALLLGAAVVIGSVAALKTSQLGSASAKPSFSSRALARRGARLNQAEIALRKALARRPPKLPKIPSYPAVAAHSATAPAAAPAAPPVIRYVRAAPIVVTTHRVGGDEAEHEHESGGSDHEGGGGDD
jgi:hypothetical protein